MQPCVDRVGDQSVQPLDGISVRVLALKVPRSIKYKRPSISTQSSSFSSSIQTPPTTLVLLFTSVVRRSFDIWLASSVSVSPWHSTRLAKLGFGDSFVYGIFLPFALVCLKLT